MKINPKYSIPIIWVLILFCFLSLLGCATKETKNENKYETMGKALGTIGNGKK